MDQSIHLMGRGEYKGFPESECDKNDKDHMMDFIGTKIRHVATGADDEEIVEYGFISDAFWSEDMDTIDCKVLLYDDETGNMMWLRYMLYSLEKLVGEKKKSKTGLVYRVWNLEGERWETKKIFFSESIAERRLYGWRSANDNLVLKKFKLVEVP
jgi:hypothetical protein